MIAILTDLDAWAALFSLTALEIVLGIDNILFISILVSRCPPHQVFRARQIGLSLAFVFRIVMLFGLTWLMTLSRPLFSIFGVAISWRDVILIGGGLFLIAKATHEIHREVEPSDEHADGVGVVRTRAFALLVMQLIAIDIVFSLDSIITAIGMVDQIGIMIAAILVAMVVMFFASGHVASFRFHSSNNQDAGACLSVIDRHGAHCGRLRCARAARVHLFRYGICKCSRSLQCAGSA